jgi:hypothetical protein
MDWTILPLQIILALQGIAVVGVSLVLIADSYLGNSENDDRKATQARSWRHDRLHEPAAMTGPERRAKSVDRRR